MYGILSQRVAQAIQVLAGHVLLGFGDQVIPSGRDMRSRAVLRGKGKAFVVKAGMILQNEPGDVPEQAANTVQSFLRSSRVNLQPLVHVFVKILQQLVDTTVGLVALVEEVDDRHVVFLAITVAPAPVAINTLAWSRKRSVIAALRST